MDARNQRIIVFGDSLSHHGRDNDPEIWDVDQGSDRNSGQPGDLLASLLAEQGAQAVRVNARVSRSATNFFSREDFTGLLQADQAFQPTKVVLILGTNDLHIGIDKTREALAAIRDAYKKMGAEVWMVGPFAYANDQLNRDAIPVANMMKEMFEGRFIDPRDLTPLVGRANDGVHFGHDSARVTAIQLADRLLSTPSPRNWLPWAIGAGAIIAIGLVWSYARKPGRNFLGAVPDFSSADVNDDDDDDDYVLGLKPAQRKLIKQYVGEAKKSFKQLETAANKVDSSIESLAKLSDDTHGKLSKLHETISNDPVFEEAHDRYDEEVMAPLEQMEEAVPPDSEDLRREGESFKESWESSMSSFKDTISDVENHVTAASIDGLESEAPPPKKPRKESESARKKRERKEIDSEINQLYSAMSYAGNTQEQVDRIHAKIDELQARKRGLGDPNRKLSIDEIMMAANDAALEGKYKLALDTFKQRETPKITTTYEKYTDESVEQGDAAERGWYDEDGKEIDVDAEDIEEQVNEGSEKPVTDALAKRAAKWLEKKYARNEDTHFHPGTWYHYHDAESREAIEDGISTSYNFHLEDFSDAEQKRVFEEMKARCRRAREARREVAVSSKR